MVIKVPLFKWGVIAALTMFTQCVPLCSRSPFATPRNLNPVRIFFGCVLSKRALHRENNAEVIYYKPPSNHFIPRCVWRSSMFVKSLWFAFFVLFPQTLEASLSGRIQWMQKCFTTLGIQKWIFPLPLGHLDHCGQSAVGFRGHCVVVRRDQELSMPEETPPPRETRQLVAESFITSLSHPFLIPSLSNSNRPDHRNLMQRFDPQLEATFPRQNCSVRRASDSLRRFKSRPLRVAKSTSLYKFASSLCPLLNNVGLCHKPIPRGQKIANGKQHGGLGTLFPINQKKAQENKNRDYVQWRKNNNNVGDKS